MNPGGNLTRLLVICLCLFATDMAYNNYRTDYDFEAYRDLHGYDFETVTEDFRDARLYLYYRF